ncbi:hypothetical protein [Streptomyces fractus]|uniref:hypothetical protein n=1 Tax=Streptomyces fractus TaxID=641806 RepID=UPI003CF06F51
MEVTRTVITVIGGLLALIGLLHGLIENKRHHVRETEAFYLRLYWELMKDLPDWVVMNQQPPPASTAEDSSADAEKMKRLDELAHRYLRLTQDEFSQRKRGLVSDATYREWARGFYTQLRNKPMCEQWHRIVDGDLRQGNESNFSHIRAFDKQEVAEHGLYDPCRMWWGRRWWRGLSPGTWWWRYRCINLPGEKPEDRLLTRMKRKLRSRNARDAP